MNNVSSTEANSQQKTSRSYNPLGEVDEVAQASYQPTFHFGSAPKVDDTTAKINSQTTTFKLDNFPSSNRFSLGGISPLESFYSTSKSFTQKRSERDRIRDQELLKELGVEKFFKQSSMSFRTFAKWITLEHDSFINIRDLSRLAKTTEEKIILRNEAPHMFELELRVRW